MYLTMLMKDNQWLPALIDRLTREQSLSVVHTILLCVYESVTDDGYRAIREYAQKGPLPQGRAFASRIGELLQEQKPPPQKLRASREHLFDYIDDLVARNYRNSAYDWKTYEAEAVHLVRAEDYDRIMNIRRMHAVRVSDEALDELMELSKLLRRAYALRKG
jgi:hypothetical protein